MKEPAGLLLLLVSKCKMHKRYLDLEGHRLIIFSLALEKNLQNYVVSGVGVLHLARLLVQS
jgi:hypothetical protein